MIDEKKVRGCVERTLVIDLNAETLSDSSCEPRNLNEIVSLGKKSEL